MHGIIVHRTSPHHYDLIILEWTIVLCCQTLMMHARTSQACTELAYSARR
jgi:hypothetical protein